MSTRSVSLLRAALLGSALCSPTLGLAQSSSVELPEVSVQGQTDAQTGGSLTVRSVQQQRETLQQNAASVGFVDAEDYKQRYANNLRDVLLESPGVYVQNRYGQELRLSVRGSGIARSFHTRGLEIQQDGIPTNLADGSGDFYQIDPLGLRSVEIYKGGNGLAHGGSQLGGVANFVTPTAFTTISPHMLRMDFGSFGTAKIHAATSKVVGNADYYLSGTFSHSEGWRAHELQNNVHINGNVGYRFNEKLETRFYFGIYHTNQRLPGALNYADVYNNPTKAAAAAITGDQARNTFVERIANRTTYQAEFGRFDLDTWLIHKYLNHPIFQVVEQNGLTYGAAPRFTSSFLLGGYRNDIILGARYFGGSNNADQYLNVAGNRGTLTQAGRQIANNVELYGENRLFFLPDVAFVAGAKVFASERRFIDNGPTPGSPGNTAKDVSKTYTGFNPKIGLLWQPVKDVQVFANITRSTDVPDFSDLNQTIGATSNFVPLEAQKAWTLELGTRGKLDRIAWDVTVYRSQVTDQLLQYTTGVSIPASTFNAPNTLLQGIEVGLGVDLFRDAFTQGDVITVKQMWNYSDFRFVNDPQYGNNRIAGVPEHVFRTAVSYKHPSGFSITPNMDIVPVGAFVDYANTFRVPGYALFGVNMGMDFANGMSAFLDIRNIADTRYVSDFATVQTYNAGTYASFYPGTGRAIYGGLRAKF